MNVVKLRNIAVKLKSFYSNKVLYVLLFIFFNWPDRFAMIYYENLKGVDEIYPNLMQKTSKNLSARNVGISCDYSELLDENHYFYKKFTTEDVFNKAEIRIGGVIH